MKMKLIRVVQKGDSKKADGISPAGENMFGGQVRVSLYINRDAGTWRADVIAGLGDLMSGTGLDVLDKDIVAAKKMVSNLEAARKWVESKTSGKEFEGLKQESR